MSKLDKIKKALEDAVKDKKGMYWETATQALKDLEELREEMEWQPIETAPKDETPVLVWTEKSNGYTSMDIAYWDFNYDCPESGKGCGQRVYKEVYGCGYNIQPTQWKPLPPTT